MEFVSNEILRKICLEAGLESTLQLCKTNSNLNERISSDCLLWRYFCTQKTGVDFSFVNKNDNSSHFSKARCLNVICFSYYLEDIINLSTHICRSDNISHSKVNDLLNPTPLRGLLME